MEVAHVSSRLLGSAALAKRWQVSQKTVLAWAKSGALRSQRTPTNQLKVTLEDAAAFAAKRQLAIGKSACITYIGKTAPTMLRALVPERKLVHWEPNPYLALIRLPRMLTQATVVEATVPDLAHFILALREQMPKVAIVVAHGKRLPRSGRLPEGATAAFLATEREAFKAWVDALLDLLL